MSDSCAAKGFAVVLADLATATLDQWAATVDDNDAEALHELRIALRRSRSVLLAARDVFPDETCERYGQEIRWLAGLTGPARDLDVFIASWHHYVDGFGPRTIAALLPVSEHLHRHRRTSFEALVDGLESERAQQLMAGWTAKMAEIRSGDGAVGRHGHRRLDRVVARRIKTAHRRLVKHGRAIDDDSPVAELHEIRKDAKKLRYLLECFGETLPNKPAKRFVRRLKALQDTLGAIQDGEVHAAQLSVVADEFERETVSAQTLLAVGRLNERIRTVKAEARTEFAERFAAFDSKKTRRALDRLVSKR